MILNLILGEKFGNMIPIYTFEKNINTYIEDKKSIDKISVNKIYINTNNANIKFYKIYINVNFSYLYQLINNSNIKQLNIICMGEIYQMLSGDKKIKEPDKNKKMNIFHLLNIMPFTSTNIDTLMVLFNKDFLDYRIRYIHKNVPLISLITNKNSNLLNDLLYNFYKLTLYSSNDNFQISNKYLFALNYFEYFKNMKKLYLPKLSNMNKLNKKFELTDENIFYNNVNYQQINFLTKTYEGFFLIKNINFKNSSSDYINKKLNLISKLIKDKENGFLSFYLYNYLIDNYKGYIQYLEISEIYVSSIMDIYNHYLKKETIFYKYNFILELCKNNIFKTIINQIINIDLFDLFEKNHIDEYGISISRQLGYIDVDNIQKYLIVSNNDIKSFKKNKDFNFIIPNDLNNN